MKRTLEAILPCLPDRGARLGAVLRAGQGARLLRLTRLVRLARPWVRAREFGFGYVAGVMANLIETARGVDPEPAPAPVAAALLPQEAPRQATTGDGGPNA